MILFILSSRRSSTAKTISLLNPRKFQLFKHQYPNTNSPFPYGKFDQKILSISPLVRFGIVMAYMVVWT